MLDFDGKVAVVTGAGGGVGSALCRQLAERGASVIGVGRTEAKLAEVASVVRQIGGQMQVVVGDITEAATAERIGQACDEAGGIDVLINNAAVGYSYERTRPGSMAILTEQSTDLWREVIDINLNGPAAMTSALIPRLLKRGPGASIVFVSSVLGLGGHNNAHAYGVSKAGTNNLVQSLAITYGPKGLRTNGVAPGLIETDMAETILNSESLKNDGNRFAFCPLGRAAQADEVASAVLFLASPAASYVNGAILTVDGGTTAKV